MPAEVCYVCPSCKGPLKRDTDRFQCDPCHAVFTTTKGLTDFAAAYSGPDEYSAFRRAYGKFFDLLGPIYESPVWYQFTLNLSGARGNSIQSIADFVSQTLSGVSGAILDVACGTATYSRRVAAPGRSVYGIDLSVGMLRQGLRFLEKERITNVHLARANVMKLPFAATVFDAAICAGSLHLFPDPVVALRGIWQTLKPGAPFAVQTFIPKKDARKQSVKQKTGFHEFQPEELLARLTESGFGDFLTTTRGTVLTVASRKR